MKLFINKDIENVSDMQRWVFGADGMSFSDVHAYMDWAKEKADETGDRSLDVEIHSCGGDTVEGYAIYDALRSCGMELTCTVVGKAASMATVILLAAPKGKRMAYEHARLLIHSPYYESATGGLTLTRLEAMKRKLEEEGRRMLDLYVDRTGVDEAVLKAQMDNGDWFDAKRAMELGLVDSIVPATSGKGDDSAKISTTARVKEEDRTLNLKEREEMKLKNEKSALAKAFMGLGKAMGLIEDGEEVKSLVITDTNGTELEFDTEDSDVKVGDKTEAADGEYLLEDGRTIVVEDGAVKEIKQPEEEDEESDEVKALKDEVASLKKQLAEAESAQAEKEATIAKQIEALAKMKSQYVPAGRKADPKAGKQDGEEVKSRTSQRLEELRSKMGAV